MTDATPTEEFLNRLDDLHVPILDEWVSCPNCNSRDNATVAVDPVDDELTLVCRSCGYNGILASGDAIEIEFDRADSGDGDAA